MMRWARGVGSNVGYRGESGLGSGAAIESGYKPKADFQEYVSRRPQFSQERTFWSTAPIKAWRMFSFGG
jgi:hypothetical protein